MKTVDENCISYAMLASFLCVNQPMIMFAYFLVDKTTAKEILSKYFAGGFLCQTERDIERLDML